MIRRATELPRAPWLHRMLVPVATVCFIATLIADIVYSRTANMLWADMSDWLLSTGVIVFGLVTAAGLAAILTDRERRQLRLAWLHLAVNFTAFILAFFDALVHTRDAYTSVVPGGLTLSALVVLLLMVTGWTGWAVSCRRGGLLGTGPQR